MNNLLAVIDIGATAIRLLIIEPDDKGGYNRLDKSNIPVNLGRDVFINRNISPESILQVIETLKRFLELINGWRIPPEHIYTVATSAVRESRNREIFVDRIKTRTGLSVQILDGVEENHLTYIAVNHAIRTLKAPISRTNSIIMEVGGGTTEVMIMHRGKMKTVLNLKIGTVRLEEQLKRNRNYEEVLQESLKPSISTLSRDVNLHSIRFFIMVGGDARLAAKRIGKKTDEHYSTIDRKDFLGWIDYIRSLDTDDLVSELGTSYVRVEGLLPALIIYKIILDETAVEEIIIPDVSMREGILLRNLTGLELSFDKAFAEQVLASARSLRKRYSAARVESIHYIGLEIYDRIASFHGLGNRERLYLEVAIILHNIGRYVNQSGYHKHGQYIIANSEIFGLTEREIYIISQVVRFHRGTASTAGSTLLPTLLSSERLIVIKLSAILRIALVLSQVVYTRSVHIELRDSTLYISEVGAVGNRLGMGRALFTEVFGYGIEFQ